MRIHQIRIRIASENTKIERGHNIRKLRDERKYVDRIAAPVLAQYQQMPRLLNLLSSGEKIFGNNRSLIQSIP